MKEYKHLGTYGLIIDDNKILLIKKFGGPYNGKLDLPGGTIEFCERPSDTLIRELKEEIGINVIDYELFDADSVNFKWNIKKDVTLKVHHIGIFYKIKKYTNGIKKSLKIDSINDDSLGAEYYNINELKKEELSEIAIMELEKLGYKI